MDLTTNGVVITDAIKYVHGQLNHLKGQERKLPKHTKNKEEPASKGKDIEPTNGVF